jgi:hypothetical protein
MEDIKWFRSTRYGVFWADTFNISFWLAAAPKMNWLGTDGTTAGAGFKMNHAIHWQRRSIFLMSCSPKSNLVWYRCNILDPYHVVWCNSNGFCLSSDILVWILSSAHLNMSLSTSTSCFMEGEIQSLLDIDTITITIMSIFVFWCGTPRAQREQFLRMSG